MVIGKKISYLRKRKKLTQLQLAEMLSVSRQAVHKWEAETAAPDILKLPDLSRVLEIDLETLLDETIEVERMEALAKQRRKDALKSGAAQNSSEPFQSKDPSNSAYIWVVASREKYAKKSHFKSFENKELAIDWFEKNGDGGLINHLQRYLVFPKGGKEPVLLESGRLRKGKKPHLRSKNLEPLLANKGPQNGKRVGVIPIVWSENRYDGEISIKKDQTNPVYYSYKTMPSAVGEAEERLKKNLAANAENHIGFRLVLINPDETKKAEMIVLSRSDSETLQIETIQIWKGKNGYYLPTARYSLSIQVPKADWKLLAEAAQQQEESVNKLCSKVLADFAAELKSKKDVQIHLAALKEAEEQEAKTKAERERLQAEAEIKRLIEERKALGIDPTTRGLDPKKVKKLCADKGYDPDIMPEILGIEPIVWERRMLDPGSFTRKEIQKLEKFWSPEDVQYLLDVDDNSSDANPE